jgi:hypothetical protein
MAQISAPPRTWRGVGSSNDSSTRDCSRARVAAADLEVASNCVTPARRSPRRLPASTRRARRAAPALVARAGRAALAPHVVRVREKESESKHRRGRSQSATRKAESVKTTISVLLTDAQPRRRARAARQLRFHGQTPPKSSAHSPCARKRCDAPIEPPASRGLRTSNRRSATGTSIADEMRLASHDGTAPAGPESVPSSSAQGPALSRTVCGLEADNHGLIQRGEQVAVAIHRDRDDGVAKPLLTAWACSSSTCP